MIPSSGDDPIEEYFARERETLPYLPAERIALGIETVTLEDIDADWSKSNESL